MGIGLMLSSMRAPGSLPVTERWMVDWSRFFQTGTVEPNLSRRIGPDYPEVMRDSMLLSDRDPGDHTSLPGRDLMSACYAGIWSVPRLYERLQQSLAGEPIANLLPDYAKWAALIGSWVAKPAPTGITQPITPGEAASIAADPPLPFFIQFEAAHPIKTGSPELGGGGRHLGPLGSIIVAETMLGAIRHFPLGVEDAGATLKARLAAAGDRLLGNNSAFAAMPEIGSMPQLLAYMAGAGAFAAAS
jgi:hypothetical protein